jgi:hypothetical protein
MIGLKWRDRERDRVECNLKKLSVVVFFVYKNISNNIYEACLV